MEMLFDHVEAFEVEEQTILLLVQIVEANGTLQPTHDSGKSDGADGAIIIAASRWLGLLVIVLLLLLGHLLLSRLRPQERDKPCLQGFVVPKILMSLVF
jgi:hypothetical protein